MSEEQLFEDFVEETERRLLSLEDSLLELEEGPSVTLLEKVFIDIHSIKSICGFFNYKNLESLCHQSEELLKVLKANIGKIESSHIDILLKTVDTIKRVFDDINISKSDQKTDIEDFLLELNEKSSSLREEDSENTKLFAKKRPLNKFQKKALDSLKKLKDPGQDSNPDEISKEAIKDEDIKVDFETINKLSGLLEEALLSKNQFNLQQSTNKFQTKSKKVFNLIEEVQLEVSRLQMQPFSVLVNKFKRLTRDMARNLNKKVLLRYKDHNQKIDRKILNLMYEPLLHVIRNAVDHGIESPAERKSSQKRETGTIEISVKYSGNFLEFLVQDDGRGISTDEIKRLCLEKNLYTESQLKKMTEDQILEIIFEPSFSSKEEASLYSGRGMGMAAIKKNAESITINSTIGIGTAIKIRMPLTKTLSSGVKIGIDGNNFVIHTTNILEARMANYEDFIFEGDNSFINYKNGRIPLVHGESFFDFKPIINSDFIKKSEDKVNIPILFIETENIHFALIVDSLKSIYEFALRELKINAKRSNKFLGTTLTNTGEILFVLNLNSIRHRLINLVEFDFSLNTKEKEEPIEYQAIKEAVFLACRYSEKNLLIPINKHSLIKNIKPEDIFHSESLGSMVNLNNKKYKLINPGTENHESMTTERVNSILFQKDLGLCFTLGDSQELYFHETGLNHDDELEINKVTYKYLSLVQFQDLSFQKEINLECNEALEKENYFQALFFENSGIKFAIQSKDVREILKTDNIVKLPLDLKYSNGVFNHRGHSILSQDLYKILSLNTKSQNQDWQILLNKNTALSIDQEPMLIQIPEKAKLHNAHASLEKTLTPFIKEVFLNQETTFLLLDTDALLEIEEEFIIS